MLSVGANEKVRHDSSGWFHRLPPAVAPELPRGQRRCGSKWVEAHTQQINGFAECLVRWEMRSDFVLNHLTPQECPRIIGRPQTLAGGLSEPAVRPQHIEEDR